MINAASYGASALFSGSSDLGAFTPTAAAYSLYTSPQLLREVQGWDGSTLPGSERATGTAAGNAGTDTAAQPGVDQWSFNPFDQTTWDVQMPAASDSAAAGSPSASSPFTFNPFDKKSWWTDRLGSNVDATA